MDAAMSPLPGSEMLFEQWLMDCLDRAMCPTSLELGEYESGLLVDSAKLQIERHVANCPACRKELNFLRDFLVEKRAVQPKSKTIASAPNGRKQIFAHLLTPGNRSAVQSAWGALRGSESEPLVFSADAVQIVLEVQEDANHPAQKVLLGLVLGLERDQEFLVQLFQNGVEVASTPLDPFGNFVFSSLSSGLYQISLVGKQMEILLEPVTV